MKCSHSGEVETVRTGGHHYNYHEVWDDIVDHTICCDCGDHIDCDEGCQYRGKA